MSPSAPGWPHRCLAARIICEEVHVDAVINAVTVSERVFMTVLKRYVATAAQALSEQGWTVTATDPDPVDHVLLTVSP